MAFVVERIKRGSEERKYIASKGFTYITGEVIDDADYWSVDRKRDIILVSRGGGGPEIPNGYAIYIDGIIIDMEGKEKKEGSRYENDLKVHWYIDWIEAPKAWFKTGCGTEKLKQILMEAFTAYAYRGLKTSQVLEVTVEINAEPKPKYNSKGEEV